MNEAEADEDFNYEPSSRRDFGIDESSGKISQLSSSKTLKLGASDKAFDKTNIPTSKSILKPPGRGSVFLGRNFLSIDDNNIDPLKFENDDDDVNQYLPNIRDRKTSSVESKVVQEGIKETYNQGLFAPIRQSDLDDVSPKSIRKTRSLKNDSGTFSFTL